MTSLYTIDLGLEPTYKNLINDIIKNMAVLIVAQYISEFSGEKNLFNNNAIDIMIYICIGILFHHFIVKKVITIN